MAYHISSGQISSGIILNNNSMDISSGGTANNTIIQYGGDMRIENGGTANYTKIYNGGFAGNNGFLELDYESYMNSTTVYSGGTLGIILNIVASHTEIKNGGSMCMYGGGESYDTIVSSGGIMLISGYGGIYYGDICIAENVDLQKGGKMVVWGAAALVTESELAGIVRIESGGKISDSTIAAGGIVYALIDCQMENISVNTSGNLYVDLGADVTDITINGGNVHVGMGGRISDVEINSGKLYLYGGAILDGVINVNGTMVLDDMTMNYGTVNLNLENAMDSSPMIENMKFLSGGSYTIDVDNADAEEYIIGSNAGDFDSSFTITSDGEEMGSISVGESLQVGENNYSLTEENNNIILKSVIKNTPDIVNANQNGIEFLNSGSYIVAYSTDNFKTSMQFEVTGDAVDTFGMDSGTYQYQARLENKSQWTEPQKFTAEGNSEAQIFSSNENGNIDVFFAKADSIWSSQYSAQYCGAADITEINLAGKNRIVDVFEGSSDANILVLTDTGNGDALFVDDIYSVLGAQARLKQINEIRAGAGDDIIDFTSSQFEYVGDGTKIYGGLGNDVIWAGNGKNTLFGDAGNDQIIGGNGDDIIVGGIGNDTLHGGGGNDKFVFGGDFGNDTVEQLANGKVTLYFESENVKYDESAKTFSDGINSVTLKGDFEFEVIYGIDSSLASISAYDDFASEKIFEDKSLIA